MSTTNTMVQIVMEKHGENLPFALVEKILLRFSVESLVRFKSVSKSWSTLFKNPSFISNQLSRSINLHHDSTYYLLLRLCLTPYTHQLFSLSPNSSLNQISITMPNTTILSSLGISNSCNGLVCLYSRFSCGRDVFLCNPTTREIRLLPTSNLVTKISDGKVLGVGLGHCNRINDFKVVRMWLSYNECLCKKFIVEEYALSSDSWRTIDSENPWGCEFETSCFALHFKGVWYWWAKHRDSTPILVALDMGGGMFTIVRFPKNIDISDQSGRYLGILDDTLSLVCRNSDANLEIWMKDDGISIWGYCWIKLRTIENSKPCVPLTFWKENELLLKIYDKVKSYNVDNEETHNVNVEVEGRCIIDVCEAMFCVKSLVSVYGKN